ncbi:DNA topoisomerase [Brackiella oedipodis]|uniref:DNA topoisomerase n=1 Tax=Brackiella oedipodis TaxID=124225 RepID=UPI00056E81F1|nr:DNA topoisomerase [Brackiella oedipodis]
MSTLIIAEKPSVARDLAKVLSKDHPELLFDNCIGHLVQVSYPTEPNQTLPIIPKAFELTVLERTKEQFKKLKALFNRKDIDLIINACDAGREGELIFRLVYEKAQCTKPTKRLWLQSMTPDAIKDAFNQLKDASAYDNLSDAARSRTEADWLFGINGSRAVKSAIGRVMTPTLAMVVRRYQDNKNFTSVPFWEIVGQFKTSHGLYEGKLVTSSEDRKERKFNSQHQAQAVLDQIPRTVETAMDAIELEKKYPRPLFSLTALQQYANKKFGYSAAKTLQLTQALYEKHRAVTYPRTDATALPTDYVEKVKTTLESLSANYPSAKDIELNLVSVSNKRVFNDKKITDHFAIIPTAEPPKDLTSEEKNIYEAISLRFIAAFYPEAHYVKTTRWTQISAEYLFKSTGKTLEQPGWLQVYNGVDEEDDKEDSEKKTNSLAPLDNPQPSLEALSLSKGQSKPPALYTEATLLKAMENAGKDIENEELAEQLKGKGLGTPATRAAIIEKLKDKGKHPQAYMTLQKKALIPTERGIALIDYLQGAAPDFISPEMTGHLEYELSRVEKGEKSRADYMREIEQYVFDLIRLIQAKPRQVPQKTATLGKCPVCAQQDMVNRKFSFMCDCGFKINKEIAHHQLTDKEVKAIIEKGKSPKITTFKSKAGKPFSAILVLDKEAKNLQFKFD